MRTWFLALVALAACNGGDTCDTNCDGEYIEGDPNGECPGCADDTGTTATGTAVINMAVLRLDAEEDCLVNLTGSKSYVQASSTDITVAAPDLYTAVAGDSTYTEQFGFPIHVDVDGEYWAAEPQDVEVEDGQTLDGEFYLFNLFEPASYTCTTASYAYNANAEDQKGNPQGTDEFPPETISVDQFGVVQTEDPRQNWDAVGDAADHLLVVNDQLELVAAEDIGAYISESDIQPTGFTLTVVTAALNNVTDLSCQK